MRNVGRRNWQFIFKEGIPIPIIIALYDNIIRKFSSLEVLLNEVLQQCFIVAFQWCTGKKKVTHSHETFMCAALSDCTVHIVHTVESRYLEIQETLKHFEMSVLRHFRFAELRKTVNRTITFNRMNM